MRSVLACQILAALVFVAVPASAAKQAIQVTTKLNRVEDIGGHGQRLISRHGLAVPGRPRIETTTPADHALVMRRIIQGGNTPSAALFPRAGAMELVTPARTHYDVPVYRVTGLQRQGRGRNASATFPVHALLPVSGHDQLGAPRPGAAEAIGVQVQGPAGPWWMESTVGELMDEMRASGGQAFKGRKILATSSAFDLGTANRRAYGFAQDTTHRVTVFPAGSSERPTFLAEARGRLVTPLDFAMTLRPGINRVELAPQRSGGPREFPAGRAVHLDWKP